MGLEDRIDGLDRERLATAPQMGPTALILGPHER
jgi:hypothetical protein